MHYCPYCSAPVSDKAKTCHRCKKVLNISILAEAFDTTDDSEIKKSALRKIKIKERMRFVWPGITLLIGFVIGGIIIFLFSLGQFTMEKNELSSKIDSLNTQINNLNVSASNAQSGLQSELKSKEEIIDILSEQRKSATSIINFTRRFTENSVITVGSEEDVTFFRNNFIYLRRQFLDQQDKLDSVGFKQSGRFNLKTIPQFLED